MIECVAAFDGDPATEPQGFRSCLGQFATGVTVVTANIGGDLVGLTVNSFASVSLNPPLILWSIGQSSTSYAKFIAAEHFAINVLAEDQILLSRHFCRSGVDKFSDVTWTRGKNGAPILDGVAAFFECEKESQHRGGDHLIVIGRVWRAVQFERNALLFAQGRYRIASDHPGDQVTHAAS
jgi:flavin reductase (DIM6/NTAB) family NADH-FMN oxidoreductase RutF